jgi:galactonate dehydratase
LAELTCRRRRSRAPARRPEDADSATCLQIDAATYNAFIQEQSLGIHYNTSNDLLDYLTDPAVFTYEDGMAIIPRGPGLGIEVNEEYVRERAQEGHRWRNPVWRHADGCVPRTLKEASM